MSNLMQSYRLNIHLPVYRTIAPRMIAIKMDRPRAFAFSWRRISTWQRIVRVRLIHIRENFVWIFIGPLDDDIRRNFCRIHYLELNLQYGIIGLEGASNRISLQIISTPES